MELKFEDLPNAVSRILDKLEHIEKLLTTSPDKPNVSNDKPMSVKEAAEFLGLSKQTIYGFMFRKVLPYYKPGKQCFFLKKDLINYLMEGRIKSHREIAIEAENYLIKNNRKYR